MLYREDRCQLVDVKRIELDEVISFTNSKLVTKSKFCRSSVAQIAHFKVKTNGKFWFSWHAMVFICFVFLLFFFFFAHQIRNLMMARSSSVSTFICSGIRL